MENITLIDLSNYIISCYHKANELAAFSKEGWQDDGAMDNYKKVVAAQSVMADFFFDGDMGKVWAYCRDVFGVDNDTIPDEAY